MTTTTLKIKPSKIKSFKEIDTIFNYGHYSHLESNEVCSKAILSKPTGVEQELVLYWEGENQNIPGGKDLYTYFADKGYEVLSNAHPSLLVNAMKELTEEKLTEMGIPSYVDVVLPTNEAYLLPYEVDDPCFLEAYRNDGNRKLSLVSFDGEWDRHCAFLLRKSSSDALITSDSLTLESLKLRVEKLENWAKCIGYN